MITAEASRQGPRLAIKGSCEGCRYEIRSVHVGAHLTYRTINYCADPTVTKRRVGTSASMPKWCPRLPAARLALAREIVATAKDGAS